MNASVQTSPQQQQEIPMKGAEEAKKEPPKLIEKVINKVEEMLTKPVKSDSKQQPKKDAPLPPTKDDLAKKATSQAEANPSPSEVGLPKGTTITLPDGKAFETQTDSVIKKGGE